MRLFAAVSILAIACLAPAQARYDLLVGGKKAGTASLTQSLSKDGIKTLKLILNLNLEGQAVRVTNESVYTPTGRAVRKFMETTLLGPVARRRNLMVTFTSQGAFVVDARGDERNTIEKPLPENAKLEDASEFWFVRDKPKPGDSVEAHQFDLETLEWRLQTTKYVGPAQVKIGKRTFEAHELLTSRGPIFVDDKGLPLLFEMGEMRLERLP